MQDMQQEPTEPQEGSGHTFVPFALLFPRGRPPVDALLGIHLIAAVTGLSRHRENFLSRDTGSFQATQGFYWNEKQQ